MTLFINSKKVVELVNSKTLYTWLKCIGFFTRKYDQRPLALIPV